MGTPLTGKTPANTYDALIKVGDNSPLTSNLKVLSDGLGNDLPLTVSSTAITITGNATFSANVDATSAVLTVATQSANDNSTKAASTAYVDNSSGNADLDFGGDNASTGNVLLNTQTFQVSGTANEIVTAASNQSLTFSLDSSGVNLPDNSTAITQTAGDSSTKIATTAFVSSESLAQDLDFSGDTGTGAVILNTETFAVTGTTNQIQTTASGTGLALSLPSTVHRDLQGNVTGNLTGDVTGDLTGNVTATSVLADGVIGTTQAVADDSTKVATTAFVQDVVGTIPAGLVFQGTWNANTNTPTLASGTGTTGHFYIVSVAGTTDLDGVTDWAVGDWAVFVEQGATDQWEKVDNSSVLDGNGTGGKISKWAGSGNSVTLTDSVITEDDSKIGIGTSSPNRTLHVNSPSSNFVAEFESGTDKASILIQDDDTLNYIHSKDGFLSLGGQSSLDSNNLNINSSSGNIGIGVSSPSQKLEVAGNLKMEGSILDIRLIESDTTNVNSLIRQQSGLFRVDTISDDENTITRRFTIDQSDGAIQFNAYGAGTLVSDASGNITSISGGGEGGPYLPLAGGIMVGNTRFNDNVNLRFGSGDDLSIYHDGSNSYIDDSGTGDLYIRANNLRLSNADASGQFINANNGGAVELYHNNSKKFETTSTGVSVTGTLLAGTGSVYGYLNPVISATDSSSDAPKSIVINNQYNGSSAEAKFVVATYGNSWHIGMGSSTHTYGNDLTFTTDATSSNSPKLRIATNGNATFSGDIMPAAENLYDIGSASVRWEDIWADQVYGRDVYVDTKIIHNGDTDNFIEFGTDTISISKSATFAGNIIFDGSSLISSNTADGSDNAQVVITGGGASGDSRGASVHMAGNEHANGGLLQLRSGSGATSEIRSYTNGAERMRINSSGNVGINVTPATTRTLLVKGQGTTSSTAAFQVNDGNNADVFVLKDDKSATFAGNITFGDSHFIGDDGDDNLLIESSTNENIIINSADDLFFRTSGTTQLQISSTAATFAGDVSLGDNKKIKLGAGNDLEIYHDGSNSFIRENGTGVLTIDTNGSEIQFNKGTSDYMLRLIADAGVKAYYDNSLKFETTSSGISVSGDALIQDSSPQITLLDTTNNTDALIYSDDTGSLNISADENNEQASSAIKLFVDGGEKMRIDSSGAVQVRNSSVPTIQLYNTDTSLGTDQTLGDLDWYQSDPSGDGVGVVAKIRGINSSSFQGEAGLAFHTGGSSSILERMRIDSSGTVTIKNPTTSNLQLQSDQTTWVQNDVISNLNTFVSDTSAVGARDVAAIKVINEQAGTNTTMSGAMAFYTSAYNATVTERMRITSGGNFLVGKTTDDDNTNGARLAQGGIISASRASNVALILNRTGSDGNIALIRNDGTQVGSISVSGSATAYNTSSDYRLKENVVEMTGALDRVAQLKPSRFNFIADADKVVDGFLAHEVQSIVPEAITGTKDAVDEEGNPDYQGIDQSKLVPLLVGAIQELRAEIELLKAK